MPECVSSDPGLCLSPFGAEGNLCGQQPQVRNKYMKEICYFIWCFMRSDYFRIGACYKTVASPLPNAMVAWIILNGK